jgi:hypothetical protein
LIIRLYHISVRNSASSLTDWFVVSVRWLTVLGLTVSLSLRERTELVNGLLNIQSVPGKGTCVQVFIPLTEEAADLLHHAAGIG